MAAGPEQIAAVLAEAMSAENRRRGLASGSTGLGALVSLPQSPNAAAVGKFSLGMPAVGEGLFPVPYVAQKKAYGPEVPQYADALVSGVGYGPGAVRQYVRDLGERRVFGPQDRAAARGGIEVVSAEAAPRRSLWSRLAARLRRRGG